MRGLAIIVLVGLTFWLFGNGYLPLTFIPAIGIWYCIKTARTDPADEIFAGMFFIILLLGIAVGLKGLVGLL